VATHASPEERRVQILLAAQSCFGKAGYHKTTMDDIVAAAGLSKGALYWHFKSKEKIFLALFDEFERAIFGAWDDLEGVPALEAIKREAEVVLESITSDRAFVETWSEFLKHPMARERFASVYNQSRARLQTTIEGGIVRGELKPCDAFQAAASITALIEGLLLQALADPGFDPLAAWPTAWTMVEGGLGA
jgi:AcrR family transcriptional regulator